jgi:NAD(P)-dependent dehydrogenase (short-subunit alcohol dehydrogenase family)
MPELIDFDSKSDNPRSIIEDDSARFAGKTIVITGAGGLLGREGCIFFCKRGARIAAMDQDAAALKETFLALQTELGHEGAFDKGIVVCPNLSYATVKLTLPPLSIQTLTSKHTFAMSPTQNK